jgi:hypothetical protein
MLKIVLIPATAAEILQESDEAHAMHHHHHHHDDKGKGKEKERANLHVKNGKGKATANANAIESGKSGKSKWREMEEIVRSETVVYPGWDRYIVRRVD